MSIILGNEYFSLPLHEKDTVICIFYTLTTDHLFVWLLVNSV